MRIRTGLGMQGVAATEVAARAAAADPLTDTATLGIPMTNAELLAVKQAGLGFDPWSPLSMWVDTGAPERFGGIWLDGAAVFVTVVGGDRATLALARCVEPPGTHYLFADVSEAEGRAIQGRIGADMRQLRASGIAVNMISYDVKSGFVEVGVTAPTPDVEAFLRDRYGTRVRVIQMGPVQPA